jgi:nucleotide-binding universal stress UspA family protein
LIGRILRCLIGAKRLATFLKSGAIYETKLLSSRKWLPFRKALILFVLERPYQAIIDTAGSKGCYLIVMASHGRQGISALLFGSETVKVLTHCKIPVLVHRQPSMT